ncbi:16S rRNA (guanine(527)-N(7))-methyltransferase RsmG, partial [Proteus sp. fly-1067]
MSLLVQLSRLAKQATIELTEKQLQQLVGYVQLLHKWNKAYNLTS